MSVIGKISVNGKSYDLDDLELGELADLEDYMGAPIGELSLGSIKATIYLVYLIKRRDNESYSIEDARKEKFVSVKWGDDDEDDNSPLGVSDAEKESAPTEG